MNYSDENQKLKRHKIFSETMKLRKPLKCSMFG